jgi:hypothetical protein
MADKLKLYYVSRDDRGEVLDICSSRNNYTSEPVVVLPVEEYEAMIKDRYCLGCDMVLKPTPLKDQYAALINQRGEMI